MHGECNLLPDLSFLTTSFLSFDFLDLSLTSPLDETSTGIVEGFVNSGVFSVLFPTKIALIFAPAFMKNDPSLLEAAVKGGKFGVSSAKEVDSDSFDSGLCDLFDTVVSMLRLGYDFSLMDGYLARVCSTFSRCSCSNTISRFDSQPPRINGGWNPYTLLPGEMGLAVMNDGDFCAWLIFNAGLDLGIDLSTGLLIGSVAAEKILGKELSEAGLLMGWVEAFLFVTDLSTIGVLPGGTGNL